MSDSTTLLTVAHQASLSITNSQSLFKVMSIESVIPSNHLILCHALLPMIFPASGSFQKSQFSISGGQSIGASASTSILPMNIQDWFPLELSDLISLQSRGLSRVISNTTVQKYPFFGAQLSLWSNSHIHMTTGKTIALTVWTFVDKVMLLLFNMLSRFVIAFLLKKSVQFSSDTQSCPSLCHPRDCSMPGSPVHYQLPELAQTHVRWGGDAIQPSHPLSSPSPPAFNLSQHQGLCWWISS